MHSDQQTHAEREISSQPECWRQAVELASDPGAADGGPDPLPAPGERVAVLGCGTSWFMAQSYAALRERGGFGETDAYATSEFPIGRRYDRVVAISRSGTTSEVLQALRDLAGAVPTVAITADPRTPVRQAADRLVVLDFADERSVVQTRFATSVLALLRTHLGEDLSTAIADVERAVTEPLPDAVLSDAELARRQFTFLGGGWTVGLANEAALKMREASLSWTEAYPAMEYRHGPISITDQNSVVWALGEVPDDLLPDVEATGATMVHAPDTDPLAELARIQRLAVLLGQRKGLDPDNPRNLTRSVVLERRGEELA